MIVNASSCTRGIVFGYARDLAKRYASSPTMLMWELGNELNLQFDACSYNKSDGNVYVLHSHAHSFLSLQLPDICGMEEMRMLIQ